MADEKKPVADQDKYPADNTMLAANVMASAADKQGVAYPSPPIGAPPVRTDFNPDARPVPSGIPGMKRYRAKEASYISDRVIQPGHIVEFPEDMEVGPNYEPIDDQNNPVVDPKKTHRLPRV
jgi:hypothetical protein